MQLSTSALLLCARAGCCVCLSASAAPRVAVQLNGTESFIVLAQLRARAPREWGCILALLQGGLSIWKGASSMWFLSGNTVSVGEPVEKYLELEQIGQG